MTVYVVRYGTCSTLVEARSAEEAELRLRTGMTDPGWTRAQIEVAAGLREPAGPWEWARREQSLKGDVFVREARPADVEDWLECGGNLSGVPKALRP